MYKIRLRFIVCILAFSWIVSIGYGQERVVSPLVAGANAMYEMAGMYYGTLPKSDPASKREEFKKLLQDHGIRALRFPGGTPALTQFLVDQDEMMRSVTGAVGYPEGDPKKYTTLWQFLDFCKEANITPIFQVNTMLYSDGKKVFQIGGRKKKLGESIVYDTSKRVEAAKALTELVKKVRERGFTLKNWELGNEEYAYFEAKDYGELAVLYSRAIRQADPDAMIWVTLGSNHCGQWDRENIPKWSMSVLKDLQTVGFNHDKNIGFTLHYVWPEYIRVHEEMVKKYGFRPRFAVTEFHMAGAGPYWDLSPRYGYAMSLAPFLISMVTLPSVEVLCVHELTSQNFGIFHYNQHSYGQPGMQTWDASLGYQPMPTAEVYRLFGKLVGGRIIKGKSANTNRLVVELGKERRILYINPTVNPKTVQWKRTVVGKSTKSFECVTLVPNLKADTARNATGASAESLGQSNQNVDPLRVDRIEEQKQSGAIGEEGLTLTVPPYSITYCRCFE